MEEDLAMGELLHVTGFRPCIDLHKGQVKQIVGSTLNVSGDERDGNTVTNFASTKPSTWYAELYRKYKLPGGHVIKLGPGNDEAALEALRAYPGGMQVGGGIDVDNAQEHLNAGASHIIVTSYVFKDGKVNFERLEKLVETVGRTRLVLDLSCRKNPEDGAYYVVTDWWQKFTDVQISKENLQMLAQYCDEFLVHGVDVEGKRVGIIEELVEMLGEWSPITVTYAGGARSIEDLELVKLRGKDKVNITIGSALDIFGGDLPFRDVVIWHFAQYEEETLERLPFQIRAIIRAAKQVLSTQQTLKSVQKSLEFSQNLFEELTERLLLTPQSMEEELDESQLS